MRRKIILGVLVAIVVVIGFAAAWLFIHNSSSATTISGTSISLESSTGLAGSATAIVAATTVNYQSTQQSTIIAGSTVNVTGFMFTIVEKPRCYPQCLAPSFLLTYLYVPAGVWVHGFNGLLPRATLLPSPTK